MNQFNSISKDVRLGKDIKLAQFINLYGCSIGNGTKIGAFVEIQKNAEVGNNCKISSHSFICEGVRIEENVFVGHNVTFINDLYPRATAPDGQLQSESDWQVQPTLVKRNASIGSGATILSNVVIGEYALVGAGSVVTRDVPDYAIVAGNPAKPLRFIDSERTNELSVREIDLPVNNDQGRINAFPIASKTNDEAVGKRRPRSSNDARGDEQAFMWKSC